MSKNAAGKSTPRMQGLDEGKIYMEKSHTLWKMDEHDPSSSMIYLIKLVSFQNVKLPTGIERDTNCGILMVIPNYVPSNGPMDPIFTMSSSWLCLAKQDRSGGTVREDLLRYVERGDFIDRSGV